MSNLSRTITGIILILIGLVLVSVPIFTGKPGFIAWIYGIPILILGFFILFNKKEDEIEGIRDSYPYKSGKFEGERIKSIKSKKK